MVSVESKHENEGVGAVRPETDSTAFVAAKNATGQHVQGDDASLGIVPCGEFGLGEPE